MHKSTNKTRGVKITGIFNLRISDPVKLCLNLKPRISIVNYEGVCFAEAVKTQENLGRARRVVSLCWVWELGTCLSIGR